MNVTNDEGSGPNSLSKGNWAITMQREEREEKTKKRNMWGTLKILLQHHWYSQKDFDNDWSEPHFSSKDKWAITMKREGREKKKEEKKRPQNHTKTPIMTYWYH
jgi:hypothetical protein